MKFLLPEMEGEQIWARRLRREALAAAALDHPFICKVYDTGTLDGRSFIAMEYVEGKTLLERLKKGPIPIRNALRWAGEMAEALEAAHRKGIIHRDIKPSNIILTEQGHVKITDFGIAKRLPQTESEEQRTPTLTQKGDGLGTLTHMSPEQARGEDLDARADLFSLGVVLYEMVTGTLPFEGSSAAVVFTEILTRTPTPPVLINPDLPDELGRILDRSLEKDPNLRYQSAADLRAELERLRRDTGSSVSPAVRPPEEASIDTASSPGEETPAIDSTGARMLIGVLKRHKALAVAGLVVVILLIAAGIRFFGFEGTSVLAQADEILITDFVNRTGDEVFDGSLKTALRVGLDESPYLNIVSDSAVGETLGYMKRPPETPITPEIGREICQRRNAKALMTGEIAQLGSTYLLTLTA